MKEIKLDCGKFTSRTRAHNEMKKAFKEWEYYGNNLDALHDCLTSVMVDTEVEFLNREKGNAKIKSYFDRIIEVFTISEKENRHLKLK